MSRWLFIVFVIISLCSGAHAADKKLQYGLLFPTPDESILELLVHEDIANADSWFATVEMGAAFLEARQLTILPRWQPAFEVGHRFGRTGVFFQFEYNESFDFTQDVKKLEIYHLGLGVDHLFLYGRLRVAASAGAAILGTQTDFDKKGTVGWYLDIRPLAVRFPVFKSQVLEFCPVGGNMSIPVARGLPLILFSYFTTFSLEFGDGGKY